MFEHIYGSGPISVTASILKLRLKKDIHLPNSILNLYISLLHYINFLIRICVQLL